MPSDAARSGYERHLVVVVLGSAGASDAARDQVFQRMPVGRDEVGVALQLREEACSLGTAQVGCWFAS